MIDEPLLLLEREVETARAKLAGDLSTLRSPATSSEFTAAIKQETLNAKDSLIDSVKSEVQSTIEGLIEDLKAKAAANPAAALAIGAGIAWRLFQRPPIATALVGIGLMSLLRTSAARVSGHAPQDYLSHAKGRLAEQASDLVVAVKNEAASMSETVKDKTSDFVDSAKDSVEQWKAGAQATAQAVGAKAVEATSSVLSQASSAFAEGKQSADNAVRGAVSQGKRTAEAWSSQVQQTMDDQETRDSALLGAASVALVAALSIAARRRFSEAS